MERKWKFYNGKNLWRKTNSSRPAQLFLFIEHVYWGCFKRTRILSTRHGEYPLQKALPEALNHSEGPIAVTPLTFVINFYIKKLSFITYYKMFKNCFEGDFHKTFLFPTPAIFKF